MESFGWVIRLVSYEVGPKPTYQYLSSVVIPDEGGAVFGFLNSQHNAKFFDADAKEVVLANLRARSPESRYDAKQLFWQAE
jgi:hypothetical protein